MEHPVYRNLLLKNLDESSIGRLALRRVPFALRREIEYPGRPIAHLFFVEEGMASMTTTFTDGSQVEVGMFGYESVIGVSAMMGTRRSLNRVYTQIEGFGYSSPVEASRQEFQLGGTFQRLALRYVQTQLVQAMQSAGCNAKHSAEQRLARWLLLCADRAHSNTFKMSHEFLADMLGSTRPTVSLAAEVLQRQGLIVYHRGLIKIMDPAGVERLACECYRAIKEHLDSQAQFESGSSADHTPNHAAF
jgi:CRP-like cAMP-binding protein